MHRLFVTAFPLQAICQLRLTSEAMYVTSAFSKLIHVDHNNVSNYNVLLFIVKLHFIKAPDTSQQTSMKTELDGLDLLTIRSTVRNL